MIFVWQELSQFYPKADSDKFSCINNAYWKKNLDIYCSQHETLSQVYTQLYNKHNTNISLMLADQYFKNTLQHKLSNSVKLVCVLAKFWRFVSTQSTAILLDNW